MVDDINVTVVNETTVLVKNERTGGALELSVDKKACKHTCEDVVKLKITTSDGLDISMPLSLELCEELAKFLDEFATHQKVSGVPLQ